MPRHLQVRLIILLFILEEISYDIRLGLTLIKQDIIEDELCNQILQEIKTTIYCSLKFVGRNEFYSASKRGLRLDLIFIVHNYEYSSKLEYYKIGKLVYLTRVSTRIVDCYT